MAGVLNAIKITLLKEDYDALITLVTKNFRLPHQSLKSICTISPVFRREATFTITLSGITVSWLSAHRSSEHSNLSNFLWETWYSYKTFYL